MTRSIKVFSVAAFFLVGSLLSVCTASPRTPSPAEVLVVVNDNSPDSIEVGTYYQTMRQIPAQNVVHIQCTTSEGITSADYIALIKTPIVQHVQANSLSINFVVLTRGVPLIISDWAHYSVDSMVTLANSTNNPATRNPYYGVKLPFNSSNYNNIWLVTRLDGYTLADAKALVDRSIASSGTPASGGAYLFDMNPAASSSLNDRMLTINNLLRLKGLITLLDETALFVGNQAGLKGYVSWGSNDPNYSRAVYQSNTFIPGAIGETYVSSSARTLHDPNAPGQSLIADLVAQGITGISGYVLEPYTVGVAHIDILFDRYTDGYCLAESYYASYEFIGWEAVVLGDPLCAPLPPPPDTVPPTVPLGLTATAVSESKINLAWQAATDNVAVAGYRILRNGNLIASGAGTSYQDTGLMPATYYTYVVQAYDAANNTSASSSSASAATFADTQPPTAPANLTATAVSKSQINLAWQASTDNIGVKGYYIYRNNVKIATTAGTTYQNTRLSASTTYTYYVQAYDAAGNTASSASASATTKAKGK